MNEIPKAHKDPDGKWWVPVQLLPDNWIEQAPLGLAKLLGTNPVEFADKVIENYSNAGYSAPITYPMHKGYAGGSVEALKRTGKFIFAKIQHVTEAFKEKWNGGELISWSPAYYLQEGHGISVPNLKEVTALGASPAASKGAGLQYNVAFEDQDDGVVAMFSDFTAEFTDWIDQTLTEPTPPGGKNMNELEKALARVAELEQKIAVADAKVATVAEFEEEIKTEKTKVLDLTKKLKEKEDEAKKAEEKAAKEKEVAAFADIESQVVAEMKGDGTTALPKSHEGFLRKTLAFKHDVLRGDDGVVSFAEDETCTPADIAEAFEELAKVKRVPMKTEGKVTVKKANVSTDDSVDFEDKTADEVMDIYDAEVIEFAEKSDKKDLIMNEKRQLFNEKKPERAKALKAASTEPVRKEDE